MHVVETGGAPRDRPLDVTEPTDLEIVDRLRQIVCCEREERQKGRADDLRTAPDDRPK